MRWKGFFVCAWCLVVCVCLCIECVSHYHTITHTRGQGQAGVGQCSLQSSMLPHLSHIPTQRHTSSLVRPSPLHTVTFQTPTTTTLTPTPNTTNRSTCPALSRRVSPHPHLAPRTKTLSTPPWLCGRGRVGGAAGAAPFSTRGAAAGRRPRWSLLRRAACSDRLRSCGSSRSTVRSNGREGGREGGGGGGVDLLWRGGLAHL